LVPTITTGVWDSIKARALPGGLGISSITGIITGTGTTPLSLSGYIIVAKGSNNTDSVTATMWITMLPALPVISYSSPVVDTIGKPASHAMSNSGGAADSIKAITALPAGMSCAKTTGAISGTPTVASPKAGYLIRAWNITGTSDFYDTISVVSTGKTTPYGYGFKKYRY
jgi:hypothetical protein